VDNQLTLPFSSQEKGLRDEVKGIFCGKCSFTVYANSPHPRPLSWKERGEYQRALPFSSQEKGLRDEVKGILIEQALNNHRTNTEQPPNEHRTIIAGVQVLMRKSCQNQKM
jgi:hypothetical protein